MLVGVCVNAVCTQCVPSVATRVVAKIYRPLFYIGGLGVHARGAGAARAPAGGARKQNRLKGGIFVFPERRARAARGPRGA